MDYIFKGSGQPHGDGSGVALRFIEQFEGQFMRRVERYGDHRLAAGGKEDFDQVFAYGEQQVKTCVTAALDAVCSSNVVQEYPVDRKRSARKPGFAVGKGKVDYWCKYGKWTPLEILVEVKHDWIRYHENRQPTVYASASERHDEAVRQLRDIVNKRDLGDYAMALTILPVFRLTISKTVQDMDYDLLARIVDKAGNDTSAQRARGFALPPKQREAIFPFKNENLRKYYESYPAVVLVWSVMKV